jgi:hypothetical protein
MEGFPCPTWTPASDETLSPDRAGFSACRKVIGLLSSKIGGTVTEKTCWNSKVWGKIVRAKIAYDRNGVSGTALATCWSDKGAGVQIALELQG